MSKKAPRSLKFKFFNKSPQPDKNGLRSMKEEGQIYKTLPQIFKFSPRTTLVMHYDLSKFSYNLTLGSDEDHAHNVHSGSSRVLHFSQRFLSNTQLDITFHFAPCRTQFLMISHRRLRLRSRQFRCTSANRHPSNDKLSDYSFLRRPSSRTLSRISKSGVMFSKSQLCASRCSLSPQCTS